MTKDLNAEVAGPLAKADSALQSVPDSSVTTNKLANSAVTSPKIADNAVGSSEVADNSLKVADIAVSTGSTVQDPGPIPLNSCAATMAIPTGHVVTGDLMLVSQPSGVAGAITASIREDAGNTSSINLVFCNVGTGTFDPPSRTYNWAILDN